MSGFFTEPIVLSKEQAAEFMDSLRHPDQKYIERLNEMFTKMDQDIHIHRHGTDMEVEIDGLDLSFLDEEDDTDKASDSNIELNIEDVYIPNTKFVFYNLYQKDNCEHLTTIHDKYMIHSQQKQAVYYDESGKDKPLVFLMKKGKLHTLQEYGTVQQMVLMA